jgi:hypothetical protein
MEELGEIVTEYMQQRLAPPKPAPAAKKAAATR